MKNPVITVSVLLVIAGVFGNYLRYNEHMPERPVQFDVISYDHGDYQGDERRFSENSYEILQADTSTLRHYKSAEGDQMWLFIAYFRSQKYGSQIHSPKHCLPGGGWQILRHESYEMATPTGSRTVNRLVIADRGRQQLMLYWFETRGGTIRNEFGLKWDLVINSLMLRPTDAAIVRLTMPITPEDGLAGATRKAEAFFESFDADIQRALPFSG